MAKEKHPEAVTVGKMLLRLVRHRVDLKHIQFFADYVEFTATQKACSFASDIAEPSLQSARRGIFRSSIADRMTGQRLDQFLIQVNEREYQVTEQESVVIHSDRDSRLIRADLQSMIRELEVANEELRASNEEIMSMNKELLSTTEELEQTREELRLLHEELTATNSRLQDTVTELHEANDDIDRLQRAGDELRRSAERNRLLMQSICDTASDGIFTSDEYGTVQSMNKAASSMFGYVAEEVIGQNIRKFIHDPYLDEHDGYFARYLRTDEKRMIGCRREAMGLRKDGSTFPIDLCVSEVRAGGCRLFTGIMRDISERRGIEQRAIQSERLAAIGQMAAGLAHESRNALQRSQNCLELLALRVTDRPDVTQLLIEAQQAQDYLHHLYEEVRDYAAPLNLKRQSCDVGNLIDEAWQHLMAVHRGRDAQLNQEGSHLDLRCEVERLAIEQVFRNILENALAACTDPTRITVRYTETQLDGDPALRVTFYDNGPGLTREARQSIFEPFYTTKTKGTGLGMAISKRIVEAHGGQIAVGNSGQMGAEIVLTILRRGDSLFQK